MIDPESQGDTLRHHRAARSRLNSCTAAVRAGTIRMQLFRHSETAPPKRRKFDHLAALLVVVRQVPSVHEPLVPFAPVGDREARVLSAPEPLPARRNECVWNLPKHTPLRCQLARPRLVCTSRQRRATVLSLSPCGGRAKDTRRLAATWALAISNCRAADSTRCAGCKVGKPDPARSLPLAPTATRGRSHCPKSRRCATSA